MNDNINDRGTKKWTSLMLPEHVEALKQMFAEEERKEKPLLDEQKKMEIDLLLQVALNNDSTVEIKYYADYDYQSIKGKLLMIDALNGSLKIESDTLEDIPLQDVIDVTIL
ncbi:MAG TPA: YolD-like family protein [Candidatus Avamphibacillus sp.]|nr:YolD-like family protein [Candidatus Avamphibacillus sp.]